MSERGLTILVLADSRSFHTERYVRELRRQGCHVVLVSLERGNIHHYTLKARGFIRSLHYVMAATEVRALIKRLRPDIINPHFVSGYGFTVALARGRQAAPVVTHLWGSDILLVPEKSGFHKRKTVFALKGADCLIGDSAYLMDRARHLTPLNEERVMPWGIERAYLQHRRPSFVFNKPLRIIVPRPHEKVYNNLFIVRALAPLVNRGLVEIAFPQWGSLSGHFRLHARSFIGDRLRIYKKLPRSKFLQFMAQHDLYLSSALSDSSPASLIEAMGLGLLPIAADIPGVREWLRDNKNGLLYEPYSAQALHDIVEQLVINDNPMAKWREANAARVEKEAIFENTVAELIALMHDLRGRHSA